MAYSSKSKYMWVKGAKSPIANATRAQKPRFLRAHELAEGSNSAKSAKGDFLPIKKGRQG
jgi:hypothetical protein